MDPGGVGGGAFGGGKAGMAQDPLSFLKRPVVILRICCLVFAIIVFGCISSQGWQMDHAENKEVCIMNKSSSACHFSTFVGIIAFLAAIAFTVGEWFFEQMSSIKTRKHYVLLDLGFSAGWAFFYFIAFCYMCSAWAKTEGPINFGSSNVIGAIFFAFLSIISWSGCAFLAYQRFKAGADTAFTQGLGDEDGLGGDGQYQSYPGEGDTYNEPPFSGGEQAGYGYQQPQY